MWGEPDEDRWLTVQVAALHGYLLELSEHEVLDQADELSALIPAILAQPRQHGDTVLALETADWLAPIDSVRRPARLATCSSEPRRCCASGWPTPCPITSRWSRPTEAEPPTLDHPPALVVGPRLAPRSTNGIVVRPCDY